MERLAERLKQYRISKGWTQEGLAREVGVTLNTVQRWEAGKTTPSPLAFKRLQDVLSDVLEGDQLKLL